MNSLEFNRLLRKHNVPVPNKKIGYQKHEHIFLLFDEIRKLQEDRLSLEAQLISVENWNNIIRKEYPSIARAADEKLRKESEEVVQNIIKNIFNQGGNNGSS